MRRMNSKNGIIDIVNEAIDEGQIEVGGGLPEIEEGDAGKVLMVNEDEDGVEWGKAGGSTAPEIITIDMNNGNELILDDETYNRILANDQALIYLYNTSIASRMGLFVKTYQTSNSEIRYYQLQPTRSTSNSLVGGLQISSIETSFISITKTTKRLAINIGNPLVSKVALHDNANPTISAATGTLFIASGFDSYWSYIHVVYNTNNGYGQNAIYVVLLPYFWDGPNDKFYLKGQDNTYIYTMEVTKSTGAYTITTSTI